MSLDVYSRGAKREMTREKKRWKAVAMAGRGLYSKRLNERTKARMFLEMMSQIIHLLVDM